MAHVVWCRAVLLYFAIQVTCAAEVLRIAFISEFTGSASPGAQVFINGFKNFSAPYFNEKGGVQSNGITWTLDVISYDTASDAANTIRNISAAIAAGKDLFGNEVGDIHAIVAGTSTSNKFVKQLGEDLRIMNIHTSGGNPATWSGDGQPFAFGMHLPFTTYTRGPIRLAALRGLKTVGIIRSVAHAFPKASCLAAVQWARDAGMTVIGPRPQWCAENQAKTGECRISTVHGAQKCTCGKQSEVDQLGYKYNVEEVPTFYDLNENLIGNGLKLGTIDPNTTAFVRAMLQDMKAQLPPGEVPDVLLNFAWEWHNVLNAVQEENMSPKMLAGWQGNTVPNWSKDTTGVLSVVHGLWSVGFGQWHQAMTFSDPLFGSNAEAVRLYNERVGFLDYDGSGAVAIGSVLYLTLRRYLSPTFVNMTLMQRREELRRGVGQLNDETMFGLLRFNRNNQNNGRDTAAWQVVPEADGIKQRCVLPSEAAEMELQLPFPTWDARFGCSPGSQNDVAQCSQCAPGRHNVNGTAGLQRTVCDTCPLGVGTSPSAVGSVKCLPCPWGSSHEDGQGICKECPAGTYRGVSESLACTNCPLGTYSATTGATDCEPCPEGTFAGDRGQQACLVCDLGRFTGLVGTQECPMCPAGTFQQQMGSTGCLVCPEATTTPFMAARSISNCICREGSWRPLLSLTCAACPDGLVCPLGSEEANFLQGSSEPRPGARAGFMTLVGAPLLAYKCLSEEECRGGAPGSCGASRDTTVPACGACLTGTYENDGKCLACSAGVDALPVVFGAIFVLIVIIVFAVASSRKPIKENRSSIQSAVMAGIFLTGLQTLGVLADLSFSWPGFLTDVFKTLRFVRFDFSSFRVGCTFDMNFASFFAIQQCMSPLIVVLVVIVLAIKKRFVQKDLRMATENVNAVGVLFNLLLISLLTSAAMPLVCYRHPNNLTSMRTAPGIICWEGGQHTTMVILCAVVFAVFLVPFVAMTCYATVRRGMNSNPWILQACRFAFCKFKPEHYYYGSLLHLRGLLVTFVPIVSTSDGVQVVSLATVFLLYAILQARILPWRGTMPNVVDVVTSACLLLTLLAGSAGAEMQIDATTWIYLSTTPLVVGLATFFAVCVYRIVVAVRRRRKTWDFFMCHHKADAAAQSRYIKMLLHALAALTVFLDSDDLRDLDGLFSVVQNDVKTFVVYMTPDVLRRPWCAGEVATAALASSVRMVTVKTLPFVPPEFNNQVVMASYLHEGCNLDWYGISMDDIGAAYGILLSSATPQIVLDHSKSITARYSLMASQFAGVNFIEDRAGTLDRKGVLLVVSLHGDDDEAVAAACIFSMVIRRDVEGQRAINIQYNTDLMPHDIHGAAALMLKAHAAVILLSRGTVQSPHQVAMILQAATGRARAANAVAHCTSPIRRGPSAKPAKKDNLVAMTLPGFTFPELSFYDYVLPKMLPSSHQVGAELFKSFFKWIAVPFSTHASGKVLEAQVADVAPRLTQHQQEDDVGVEAQQGLSQDVLDELSVIKASAWQSHVGRREGADDKQSVQDPPLCPAAQGKHEALDTGEVPDCELGNGDQGIENEAADSKEMLNAAEDAFKKAEEGLKEWQRNFAEAQASLKKAQTIHDASLKKATRSSARLQTEGGTRESDDLEDSGAKKEAAEAADNGDARPSAGIFDESEVLGICWTHAVSV